MSSNTCANCGKEGDDFTNTCNNCNSVLYCNAACKKKHRTKHKKACERRVAELHDKELFKQPPQLEDCPICFLRMPYIFSSVVYKACCGKMICTGCIHAVSLRDDNQLCPFCRTPSPTTKEEKVERFKKRMGLNDATVIYNIGGFYSQGLYGLPQNHAKALELWHRAGELGHYGAYNNLGVAYKTGVGTQRDDKKATHYYELGAMAGNVMARYYLGILEKQAGNIDRALKHWMIAVERGNKKSLENIKQLYMAGNATKDDYTNALRLYQEYLDDIKSKQRDDAATYKADWKYY